MNDSTSNQLNKNDLDYSSETNHADETRCVVDEKFILKVGMIFKTLEEAGKNTTRKGDEVKNQLIVCSREGRWKSKISPTLKTNPSDGLNCPARIYVHIMNDVGLWIISKVVLNHSHPCCPDRAEILKQHREVSMFVRCTIETNEEARTRSSKTYQLFVVATGSHHELSFIEKDVRNYITREVMNVSEQDDAKEFGKRIRQKLERFPHKVRPRRQQLALREQREREFDAADFHTVIPCAIKSVIEAQFQHVYTHDFREVQAQFRSKVNCITRSMHSTLGFTTYEVVEQVSNSKFNKFFVTYDAISREGHTIPLFLSVLRFERVDNSKNIKRRHTYIKSSQDEPLLEPRSKIFDDLVFQSHNICKFASESKELTGILHRAFDKVMAEMQEYQERSKGKSSLSHEEATLSNLNGLQSPPRVKTRGQPKNRLGSNLEKKISNAKKKMKKTAPSELNLLDGGSNIQSSYSLYNASDMNYPREDYTRLERAADGFGSLIASNARITWSLILFISRKRIFKPYSCLKSSISSYISIKRN
ncbi:hypothetical protein Ahy_B01g053534 [Arachis hypogaea]|uniref:Protein FAR1-RELATED SEQUENCE n=1 Tax=Arachis hypogaea TaxID=3818 RepID=A0A445ARX5_ARAHY|nr:hypothetical protein Ahy_B01g053534 [Arachis hypogaea]